MKDAGEDYEEADHVAGGGLRMRSGSSRNPNPIGRLRCAARAVDYVAQVCARATARPANTLIFTRPARRLALILLLYYLIA